MDEQQLREILTNFKADIINEVKGQPSNQSDNQPSNNKEANSSSTDAQAMMQQLLTALETKNKQSTDDVYNTLFDKELKNLTTKAPAFGDYLDSTDDYGDIIKDKIRGIDDYGNRIETLNKVFKTFATASSGGDDPSMQTSKKILEKAKQHDEETSAVVKDWRDGNFSSREEFTQKFFGTLRSHMDEIANSDNL